MKAVFVLTLDLDEGLLELDARRRGCLMEQMLTEVVTDCECRLHDAVRWRDGVEKVTSRVSCDALAAAKVAS